jgi:hypothetical protein
LEKLSLGSDCLIDGDISSVLEATLANADCCLKSFSVDNFFVELPGLGVDREMDVTAIARGLGLNNSINHLKCTGRYSQVLLGDMPNDSLKVLDIDVPEQFGEHLSNSLKHFILCSFERSGCTSQFWQEYSPILGKCRSVEGTYNGNHTIETINIGLNYEDGEDYEEYEEVFTMPPEL